MRQCITDWYGLSPQYDKVLRSLHHEASKFMTEYTFNLICLLNLYAETDRIDRRFNEDAFILVTRDNQWVEQNFFGSSDEDASRAAT